MNTSNYRFTLDMQSNQSQVSLPVKVGDTKRTLYITLTDRGNPYIIEKGCRAIFTATKPDGKSLFNDCVIMNDMTVIRYEFTEQTANVSGRVDCEIRLYDPEYRLITSPAFCMVVDERVVYDEDAINTLSETEATVLDNILRTEQSRVDAEIAREEAEDLREERLSIAESRVASCMSYLGGAKEVIPTIYNIPSELLSNENEDGDLYICKTGDVTYAIYYAEPISGAIPIYVQSVDWLLGNITIEPNKAYSVRLSGGTTKYFITYDEALPEHNVISELEESAIKAEAEREQAFTDFMEDASDAEEQREKTFAEAEAERQRASSEQVDYATASENLRQHYYEVMMTDAYERMNAMSNLNTTVSEAEETRNTNEQNRIEAENIRQENAEKYWNALRATSKGKIVRVDDVSPVEHTIGCRVRGKNLFNTLSDYKNGEHTYSNGTLTMTDRYAHKFIKLEEEKTYTFSCKSTRTGEDGGGVHIRAYKEDQKTYVDLPGGSLISSLSPTVTVTMPKDYQYIRFAFYGHSLADGVGEATYTEMMLEEGTEATGYVPYVELDDVSVARYGKNLLDLSRATFSYATYNKDVNGITCKISNSYYSGVRIDYLNDFLLANKGKTVTFSIADAIEDAMITLLIYGARTSGKTNQEGSSTGKREISFAISEEFTAITGLEVRVNRKTTEFTDTTTIVRNMQIEVSDTATDFEEYKESATYTPNADGIVDGIRSLNPTMTILTDTEDINIEIAYNQDINALRNPVITYSDYEKIADKSGIWIVSV